MARAYLLFCLVLLFGCGGGGDSGTDPSNPKPPSPQVPPSTDDPLKQFINVKEAYKGSTSAATLNNEMLGKVYLYIATLAPELLPDYNDDPGSVGTTCTHGGSLSIVNGSSDNEKKVLFDNCSEDGMITNGQATLRANKFSVDGELIDSTLIFENVQIESLIDDKLMGKRVLSGTTQFKELGSHCPQLETTNNLLFTDPQTQHQVLYSDFKTYRIGSSNLLCSANNSFSVRGTIYDSDAGFWDLRTTVPFVLKTMVFTLEEKGSLTIIGANSSSAKLAVEYYTQQRGNLISNYSFYRINLFEPSNVNEAEKEFIFLHEYFNPSMLFDFNDDDNDGITNGWELAFGLNPLDTSDAASDLDNDGYSNLQEYLHWGHPNDAKILPRIADLSLSLSHEPKNYGSSIEVKTVILSSQESSQDASFDIHYTTQMPTRFDSEKYQQNHNCTVSSDAMNLSCQFDNLPPGDTFNYTVYLSADDSITSTLNSSVTATVTYQGHDFSRDNDSATIDITRLPVDIQLGFSVPNDQLNMVMVVGEQEEAEFNFIQQETSSGNLDPLTNLSINLSLPEFATIVSGQCYSHKLNEWYDCLENNQIVFNENSTQNNFKLAISGHSQGQGHITFSAKSSITNEQEIGFAEFPLVVGQTTQGIQQQIDNAVNAATVFVPNGVYLGAIDIRDKQIKLKAESHDTVLYYDVGYIGAFSEASIKLGQSSQLDGFTIASHFITVEQGHSEIKNNLFDGSAYHLIGTTIINYDTLTLAQNRFIGSALDTGYLYDYVRESYHCPYVETGTYYEADKVTIINATNNVFSGNLLNHPDVYFACDFIRANSDATVTMHNNTLQGMGKILELVYDGVSSPEYKVDMTNNIISKSRFIINNASYASTLKEFTDTSIFKLNHNLVFEVGTPFSDMLDRQEETNSVLADPLIDYTGSPIINSPSIDAGAESTLDIDINGTIRPLDGDNNGSKVIDIGAIEFQLN